MKAESVRKPVALRLPRLLWRLVRVGFRQETEFRVDFWLTIIQFLVYNALFVTFWRAITSGTMALGPWTTGELIVFSFMGELAGDARHPLSRLSFAARDGARRRSGQVPLSPRAPGLAPLFRVYPRSVLSERATG